MATDEKTLLEPYIGPVPFETKDEALFFGRDSESDELLSLAVAHPVVLMYAQSGAGKTSLLNANLLPKLKKEGYDVLPTARVQGTECGPRTNIYIFNTLMSWSDGAIPSGRLETMSLKDFLDGRAHQKNNVNWELPRFVTFDQFEELFTAYPQRWQERKDFFLQIRDALEKDYLLRIIFAMREDYIAELDAYASLLPEKLRTRFRLGRPREKAALAAIVKPLQVVKTNRHFDAGVAEQLVRNLMMIPSEEGNGQSIIGEYVEPVQLQVVCQSLWRNLGPQDEVITFQHLEHCGDVNRALGDFYEQCLTQAAKTGVRESELRTWFGNALITLDGTRGMVFRGPDYTGEMPNSAVDVLQKLHVIKEEKRGKSRWYELAHDRFIEPIRKSNEQWWGARAGSVEIRQRLEARARQWARLGRGSEGLLDEGELLEADRWLNGPDVVDLPPTETILSLMSASRAAIREVADSRELAQAQAIANEQQKRLRQFRWGLVASALALIVMTLLVVFAFRQRTAAQSAQAEAVKQTEEAKRQLKEARDQRREADTQRELANQATVLAETRRKEAEKAQKEAVTQRSFALEQAAAAKKAEAAARAAELKANQGQKDAETARSDAEEKAQIVVSRDFTYKGGLALRTDPELSVLLARNALEGKREQINLPFQKETVMKGALELLHQSLQALRDHETLEIDGTSSDAKSGERVLAAALSPNAQSIALGTQKDAYRSIRVFDIAQHRLLSPMAEGNPTFPAAFTPDGKYLITASARGSILLWDPRSEKLLDETELIPKSRPRLLALSDTRVLMVGSTNEIVVWDIEHGRFSPKSDFSTTFKTENPELKPLTSAAISRDGNFLGLGGDSGAIFLRNARTGQAIANPTIAMEKSTTVTMMKFSDDDRLFSAVGSSDPRTREIREIRWWNLQSGPGAPKTLVYRWPAPLEEALAFSPDLKSLASKSLGSDFTVRVRKLLQFNSAGQMDPVWLQSSLIGHKANVISAAFASAGSLTTVGLDGRVNVWDISVPGKEVATFVGPWVEVGGITFIGNSDKQVLASIADDTHATAEVWDIETGRSFSLRGHTKKVWAVDYNATKGLFATGGADKTAKLWNARTGSFVKTLERHGDTVRELAFSPDGERLVTSSDDGTAIIWNVDSGAPVRVLEVRKFREQSVYSAEAERTDPTTELITGVAFSPDGKQVATACWDGTAVIWDAAKGKPVMVLQGHDDRVWKVAFSPDGVHLATASHDGTAKVWNLRTGTAELTLRHNGVLWGVAYNHDGTMIATASADRTARIWDAKTGKELVVLTGHQQGVNRAVFSADSRRVATSSEDGTVRVYSLDIRELIELSRQRVPGEVTLDEQGNYVRKQ